MEQATIKRLGFSRKLNRLTQFASILEIHGAICEYSTVNFTHIVLTKHDIVH